MKPLRMLYVVDNPELREMLQEMLEGDRVSPTQPVSVGMPQLAKTKLAETAMWGAALFAQL